MPSKKGSWCLSLARREKLAGKRWSFRYVARTALFIRAYGDKTWLARTIPLGSRTELRSGSGTLPSPRHRRQGGASGLRSGRLPARAPSRRISRFGSAPDVETRDQALPIPDCLEPMISSRPRPAARRGGRFAGGMPRPHRHSAASRAVKIMPLGPYIRAFDVPEPLQRIRAQGETEAGSVRCVHHAVRTDVERLVE